MYNTEIFDALGVKPAETFDELVELARTIGEEAPGAGFPDTYGIGARGARQWATIHPGFMTQYSREGGKDFELQGDVLVPVMNSDVAVTFTDKWAAMLRDAGIRGIYTTEYKRTQQTAAPLAKALGIEATVVPAREMKSLVEKLKSNPGNVLVVGHSNTVGEMIAALGVTEPVKVGDADYDNLFVVVRSDKPTLVRLHYH